MLGRGGSYLTTSRAAVGLHILSLPNVDLLLVLAGCRTHALLDLSRHSQEGLFDVAGVLRGCLEEWDAE